MLTAKLSESVKQHFRSGEVIFSQGDVGSTMISIVSGSVAVIKDGVVIAHRGPGETVGEMSMVENAPRFATIVAENDCEIVECDQERFLEVIREDPSFALGMMRSLSQRLRESDSLRIHDLEENNLSLQMKNKELALVNTFLEQLIEQSPAGIIITNKCGEIQRANPAASRIFDTNLANSMDTLLSYFVDCNPIENLWNSLESSWVGECKAKVGNRTRTLYLSVSRLYSYDPESSYLFIGEDISELIELNEQIIKLERLATEGEISSGIAHDIRNYLAVLRGNFDLMQYKFGAEFKQQHAHHIQGMERGFLEIEKFVENLMGEREGQSTFAPVDLAELVRVMVKFLAPQKRFRPIKMTTAVDPAFPRHLWMNQGQIQQTLLNLLINAADALSDTEMGSTKEISIKLTRDPDDGRARMIVADTGPGIPPERLPELFTKRFTTKERGHGIGLMTVKKIIDHHQGTIEVNSTPGVGTEFIITFSEEK